MFRMFWIFSKIKVFQYGPFQKFIIQRLRNKCPYSQLFSSTFSYIRTEYGEIPSISPYSVQMQENADQNNSEYEHLLRSEPLTSLPKEFQQYRRVSANVLQSSCTKLWWVWENPGCLTCKFTRNKIPQRLLS